jgi:phage tail sheath gpL-like
MTISFNNIPANWQLPLVHIEVDPSQAGTRTIIQPALLVGQKLTAGTAPADQPIAIASAAQAIDAFGVGSMLERMVDKFLANNLGALLYCLPLAEPGAGTAATGAITVSGAPTQAGVLYLYIAGQRVSVALLGNESTAQAAVKITAAIQAATTLPVSAVTVGSASNLTCKWKGLTGNDIVLTDNYHGVIGGESRPSGLTLTYSAMSGGAGAPSMTAAITAVGDDLYDYVGMPFTDTVSLGAWEVEYGFSDAGRWGWLRQSYGTLFTAIRDTYANHMAYGATQNSPVISMLAIETSSPSPVWEWTAAYTSKAARALLNDPARPLQTLEFEGIMPAKKGTRFNTMERNNLLHVGLSAQSVSSNAKATINRGVMQYQKNSYGQPDTAYHDITTLHTLAFIFRALQARITSIFPRHKLANDGVRYGTGQAIVTPNGVRGALVAAYGTLVRAGMVENIDAFKANLIVERNANDPNRLDALYPPDLVNQLNVFAVLAQFRLQYPTTTTI